MPGFRPLAIVPFALSLSAFVLTIVLVLAGSNVGMLEDYNIISVNTSQFGQNLISFTPINGSATTTDPAAAVATATGVSSDLSTFFPTTTDAAISSPTDAAVTSPTDVASTSTTDGAASTTSVPDPAATNAAVARGLPVDKRLDLNPLDLLPTGMTNLLPTSNPLSGAIGSLESGLTTQIDAGLQSATTSIVNNMIAQLGLQQYYNFYVLNVCEGTFFPNAMMPGAKRNTTVCEATPKAINLTAVPTPDFMVIGGTNISIPALQILPVLGKQLDDQLKTNGEALFGLYIISLLGSGLTWLFSLFMLFTPSDPLPRTAASKLAFYPAFHGSITASNIQFLASIAVTLTANQNKQQLGSLGPLGIQVTKGSKFITVTWVAWFLAFLSAGYYIMVYWKEFRTWRIEQVQERNEKEALLERDQSDGVISGPMGMGRVESGQGLGVGRVESQGGYMGGMDRRESYLRDQNFGRGEQVRSPGGMI